MHWRIFETAFKNYFNESQSFLILKNMKYQENEERLHKIHLYSIEIDIDI
jgi:hypothetical protein